MCCEVSAQNTRLFWVEAEAGCFAHVSLNANERCPHPFSRIVLCLYSFYLQISAKINICLVLIIMSMVLKSCVLKSYQFKLLIHSFLSAHIRGTRTERGCDTEASKLVLGMSGTSRRSSDRFSPSSFLIYYYWRKMKKKKLTEQIINK